MKAIDRLKNTFITECTPEVRKVTYKHGATGFINRRKGYSVLARNAQGFNLMEQIRIEPVSYSNGDKWLVSGFGVRNITGFWSFYAKNLNEVCKTLKV